MFKKVFSFLQNFIIYTMGYLWYFAVYLIIVPYLVLLVGRNLDVLIFDYLLDQNPVFLYGNISIIIALILGLFGGWLILWSFYTLYFYSDCFPFSFFPFPGFNPKKLSTYGPYALVRHPMTLGYLFLLTAFGFYYGSLMTVLWIVPVLSLVFYEYIKNREERRLMLWFGREYEEYRKKTPMLFPKLVKVNSRPK